MTGAIPINSITYKSDQQLMRVGTICVQGAVTSDRSVIADLRVGPEKKSDIAKTDGIICRTFVLVLCVTLYTLYTCVQSNTQDEDETPTNYSIGNTNTSSQSLRKTIAKTLPSNLYHHRLYHIVMYSGTSQSSDFTSSHASIHFFPLPSPHRSYRVLFVRHLVRHDDRRGEVRSARLVREASDSTVQRRLPTPAAGSPSAPSAPAPAAARRLFPAPCPIKRVVDSSHLLGRAQL